MAGALKVRTDAGTWTTIAGEATDGAPGQGVPAGGGAEIIEVETYLKTKWGTV